MTNLITYRGLIILGFLLCLLFIMPLFSKKTEKPSISVACPKCHSKKVSSYKPKQSIFSAKAALIGQAINGREGAMYAMLYEADKNYFRCQFCGHHFTKKDRYIK